MTNVEGEGLIRRLAHQPNHALNELNPNPLQTTIQITISACVVQNEREPAYVLRTSRCANTSQSRAKQRATTQHMPGGAIVRDAVNLQSPRISLIVRDDVKLLLQSNCAYVKNDSKLSPVSKRLGVSSCVPARQFKKREAIVPVLPQVCLKQRQTTATTHWRNCQELRKATMTMHKCDGSKRPKLRFETHRRLCLEQL